MYSSPSSSISILLTDGVAGLVADNPTMSQVVLSYMLPVAGAIATDLTCNERMTGTSYGSVFAPFRGAVGSY